MTYRGTRTARRERRKAHRRAELDTRLRAFVENERANIYNEGRRAGEAAMLRMCTDRGGEDQEIIDADGKVHVIETARFENANYERERFFFPAIPSRSAYPASPSVQHVVFIRSEMRLTRREVHGSASLRWYQWEPVVDGAGYERHRIFVQSLGRLNYVRQIFTLYGEHDGFYMPMPARELTKVSGLIGEAVAELRRITGQIVPEYTRAELQAKEYLLHSGFSLEQVGL